MDYQKKLKEWYEHYEARYKKAVSLHIDEGSRHYQAFREVQICSTLSCDGTDAESAQVSFAGRY